MVRTYKRKKDSPWTAETMIKALSDIRDNKMRLNSAAKYYKIPESTLRSHFKAPADQVLKRAGRPTVLTVEEEREIELTCQLFAELGYGITKPDVLNVVAEYCSYHQKSTPFHDGRPGEDWWDGFLKRHPSLVLRTPQQLQIARARMATKENVDDWFLRCLKPQLQSLELLDKPQWIFNVDETGFSLSGKPGKVLAKKGIKSPQSVIGGSGREYITVQTCVSGIGELLPPYVVYAGKNLMANSTNNGPFGTRYCVTENGWMNTITFIDWLRNHFIPYLPDDRPPVLLVLDGHSLHVAYEVRLLAKEHSIHLLKLPSHLTYLLQPLDIGVFKEMKHTWDNVVKDYTRQERKPVTKTIFPTLLRKVWQAYKPEYGRIGFQKTGIHPFDKNAILPSSLSYSTSFQSHPGINPLPTDVHVYIAEDEQQATCTMINETPSPAASTLLDELPPSFTPTNMTSGQNSSTSSDHTCQYDFTASSTTSSASDHEHQLRFFFGELLKSTSTSQQSTLSRKRLTSQGQSLTSDEAMALIAAEDAAKKQKEKEKLERKRKRVHVKRKENNKRRTHQNSRPKSSVCMECETWYENDSSDEDWVECSTCLGWYHLSCAGLDNLSDEEINDLNFTCSLCS